MSEKREGLADRRFVGDSIRPPDVSTRSERPKTSGDNGPVVINIGHGPVTGAPGKSGSASGTPGNSEPAKAGGRASG